MLFLMITTGCLGPVSELYPEDDSQRTVPVFVISHGWHTGIALESSIVRKHLPDHPEIPDSPVLMFGWGDNRYYPNPEPGFGLLLRAALLPTGSVLHVVGIDVPIEDYFSRSQIIEINVTENGADNLALFISGQFHKSRDDSLHFHSSGLYANSAFFKAEGLYFFPKTSNRWTARAVRSTGYPITPFYAITSANLMKQARKEGEVIQ
jgi:uncharacterized protein (TIGR02117 family)